MTAGAEGGREGGSAEGDRERIPLTAVLAGGKARRMGAEKARLPLEGIPLVERVLAAVAPVSARVVVVGGPERVWPGGVPTVPDRHPGADSLGGIATALWHAASRKPAAEWVLCVACDLPLLRADLLSLLFRLRRGHDVVVPRVPLGYEPLCALYRTNCLPVFEEQVAAGLLRVRTVFTRVRTREVGEAELRAVDPDLRSFLNVNRPEDLERARRVLRGEEPGGP